MRYKYKLLVYIITLNVVILLAGIYLWGSDNLAFLAIELVFVIFLIIGINLYRQFSRPFDMLASGAESLKDQDFSLKLKQVKSHEFNKLIEVYNRMIDQLRTERVALSEKSFLLAKLMEASPSGILIFDFDDRLSEMNSSAERFTGVALADVKGKKLPLFSETIGGMLNEIGSAQNYIFRKGGSQSFRIQNGSFVDRGFETRFILIEDLSYEIHRTEKSSYEKVIRMMSHEVNNSVAAVNSMLHTIKPKLSEPRYADALRICIERNENMNLFMRNFASVVRIPEPKMEVFELNQLIQNAAQLITSHVPDKTISLRNKLISELVMVNGDQGQIEQVLINIFKNAVEAIQSEGVVEVESKVEPVRVYIRNNGKQLTKDQQQKIFTPFYTTKEKGQGIGLMLVREILANHQCRFDLESKNGMTEFSILFSEESNRTF